jgi:hypothetical protein
MHYQLNPATRSFGTKFAVSLFLLTAVGLPTRGQTTQPSDEPASVLPAAPPGSKSRISDEGVTQLDTASFPPRPKPIIEIGNPFFGSGLISHAVTLPTGQVLTPTFIVFGTFRTVFQAFDNPQQAAPGAEHSPRVEWANRLDLYGNLQLSGTERILIGIRPFDDGVFAHPAGARYYGENFNPTAGAEGAVDNMFNARITTLFFEGDLGQIFPKLDPFDSKQLDIGFSVGRQPLLYQDGLFIDDDMDAVGVTRNTFIPKGSENLQATAVYAWSQINRGDGINHNDAGLMGLFFNADVGQSTLNLDTAYVFGRDGHGDGAYAAISATQRIGQFNTKFHLLGSKAMESDPPTGTSLQSLGGNGSSAVGNGALLFAEVSRTLPWTKDIAYFDAFWGIDHFTSASRGPDRGGPLGRVGILFAEQPIGRYGSALSSSPERAVGAALGYQKFLDAAQRRQLILELGTRISTDSTDTSAVAAGARFQQAFGQHFVLQLDAFGGYYESMGFGYGGRTEFRVEF